MNYEFRALIQGGEGPDVWDKEIKIDAVDFLDAAKIAVGRANDFGGQVVELSQSC